MSSVRASHNLAASIRQRPLDRARARGEDFQLLLDRYAVERLLYRLSISDVRDEFLLKAIFVEESLALAARTTRRNGA